MTNIIATIHSDSKKIRYKIYCYTFSYRFISDHITIDNYYYLLLLCKTQLKTKRC